MSIFELGSEPTGRFRYRVTSQMEIAPSRGDEDDLHVFCFLHLFLLNCGDACIAKVMEDLLDGDRDEDDKL